MATEPRIGTRIRRARERKRMRQRDLADALGVSRTTVDAWENDRAYPRNSIGAIEDVLGISLNREGEPEPELVDDETRALIYRKFSRDEAALAIGAIEQTLRARRPTSPGEEQTASQDR